MHYNQYVKCNKCKGQGFLACTSCFCPVCISDSSVGRIGCNNCNSTGKIQKKIWLFTFSAKCPHCNGVGDISCPNCGGVGHLPGCDDCCDLGYYICDECGGAGQCISEEFRLWIASMENLSTERLNIEYEKRQLELTKLQIKDLRIVQQEYQLRLKFEEAEREFKSQTEFFYSGDYFGDLYKHKEKEPSWEDWSRDIVKSKKTINNQIRVIQCESDAIAEILNLDRTKPNAFKSWKRNLDRTLTDILNEKAELNTILYKTNI
jgi:hypothetical protein